MVLNKIRISSLEYADRNVHLTSLYTHSSETQQGGTRENIHTTLHFSKYN